jgi:hypothetical protein
MTDRELMQMALSALKGAEIHDPEAVQDAIKALRDRLAQPEWVGLTDEEIDAALKSCNTVDTYKYFRAVEAKLKEKNT